jgi:hypothetical protein
MTLRMEQVAGQLRDVVTRYREQLSEIEQGLSLAEAALAAWASDPEAGNRAIQEAMAASAEPYALALAEGPDQVFPAPPFSPVTVVAADGSSIDPDRFGAVPCYVINTGFVVLPYGTGGLADLGSHASVGPNASPGEAEDAEGRGGTTGWGVNLRRDVHELEAGARLAAEHSAEGPAVLLLDGTLLPWDLDSRQVAEPIRQELTLRTGAALDALRDCPDTLAIGAYVSGSRAGDVSNSLAALQGERMRGWPASDGLLFGRRLREGDRSAVFLARSERARNVEALFRDQHRVCFFYVRVGDDVARVETPEWAASQARIERLHAVLVDQCQRCGGYPRGLQEAHEQAVISAGDREQFARLLEAEAGRQGLRAPLNGKRMSKRRRAL